MSPLLIYLFEANLSLSLGYLAYRFVLDRLTFYRLNRRFLLSLIFFSVTFPALSSWLTTEPLMPWADSVGKLADQWPIDPIQKALSNIDWELALTGAFLLGFAISLSRLGIQAASLWHLHRQTSKARWGAHSFQQINQDLNPFSFGRRIYLNPALYSGQELTLVLAHEQVHVQQAHTLDLMVARLLLLPSWFNPLAYQLRNRLAENLEFLTDQQVLKQGFDRKAYQYSLLQHRLNASGPSLSHPYRNGDLKRRILRMKQAPSPAYYLALYGLLPVSLISLVASVSVLQTRAMNHFAFYRQMDDPAFIHLQQQAASYARELEAVQNRPHTHSVKQTTAVQPAEERGLLPR